MTVAELITKLQALPNQSQRVVVNGYEGGYSDVIEFEQVRIKLNHYKEWYYGAHREVYDDEPCDEIAVCITR